MSESIKLTEGQAALIYNNQHLFSGSTGAVERQDFCQRIEQSAKEYNRTPGLVKEFSISRATLSGFMYGIIGGWTSQGKSDNDLRQLRSIASSLKIWKNWILPKLPKVPEEKEELPLDMDVEEVLPLDEQQPDNDG